MKHVVLTLPKQKTRRGVLIVEAVVAALILGAAVAMLVPALTAVRRQRMAQQFEALAMVELNNIEELLPETLPTEFSPKLNAWFQDRYRSARLEVELLPISEDAPGLQPLRMTIRKPLMESMPEQVVSVVIWRKATEVKP